MNTELNHPTLPKWTALSTEAFAAFPSNQSTLANQQPQCPGLALFGGGRAFKFHLWLGGAQNAGKRCHVWRPSGKRTSGAVSLIYRTDNLGYWPLASTKGDGPERVQLLSMGSAGPALQSPAPGRVWLGSLMSPFHQQDQNQLSEQHKPGVIFSPDVTF